MASHRDYLLSGYPHHRHRHGLLIRPLITPYLQSPARQKCQRTEAGERGNYWHADASAWCCYARCKIHEGVSWCLAWKWCSLRDDVAAGRRQFASKQSVDQCVKPPPPPAWIMQPPRLADAAERDYFTLRGWSLCKNNWKEPRSMLMSSTNELPISMGNSCNYCEQYTRASSGMMLVSKPGNHLNVCWFNFAVILHHHKFWLHRQFLLHSETKKWWVMVARCYCCRFVLNSKRLLSTSCNNKCSMTASSIFHGVIPDAFWSSRIVCVKIKQTLNNELKFHIVVIVNVCQVR